MLTTAIQNYIETNLTEKRYRHSIGVANEAVKLAEKYGADTKKAYFAGIAHDLAKEIPEEELRIRLNGYKKQELLAKYPYPLLHGPAAAVILKEEFSVFDEEVLDAVFYHTTGKEDMNLLTKIIYLADFIEPGRKFPGIENVRYTAYKNLDEAIIIASGMVIINTIKKGKELHPDTIISRNYLLKSCNDVRVDF